MPTTGGPTNLPQYESFYFKKVIFYSKHLSYEKEMSENTIEIDINNPFEFYEKIIKLKKDQIESITDNAFEFYKKKCSFQNFKKTYLAIIEEFLKDSNKWK